MEDEEKMVSEEKQVAMTLEVPAAATSTQEGGGADVNSTKTENPDYHKTVMMDEKKEEDSDRYGS